MNWRKIYFYSGPEDPEDTDTRDEDEAPSEPIEIYDPTPQHDDY